MITRRRFAFDLKTGDSEALVTGPLLVVEFSGLWSAVSFVSSVSEIGLFLPAKELLLLLGLAAFPFVEEGLKNALVEKKWY
jgi:NADH:ubiquinone oxidoreductase subunit H